jgi:hypothetical protein
MVTRTPAGNAKLFKEQYGLLKAAVNDYFDGVEARAIDIAVRIRTLVHATGISHAFLATIDPNYKAAGLGLFRLSDLSGRLDFVNRNWPGEAVGLRYWDFVLCGPRSCSANLLFLPFANAQGHALSVPVRLRCIGQHALYFQGRGLSRFRKVVLNHHSAPWFPIDMGQSLELLQPRKDIGRAHSCKFL